LASDAVPVNAAGFLAKEIKRNQVKEIKNK
jgi:hypothetical protein